MAFLRGLLLSFPAGGLQVHVEEFTNH